MKIDKNIQLGFTKYVTCPTPYYIGCTREQYTSGYVAGVWCKPDDEVIWIWCDNQIIGYTIKPISSTIELNNKNDADDEDKLL